MQAVKTIYKATSSKLLIDIPKSMQHHDVEVIVSSVDKGKSKIQRSGWPPGFLDKFFGCMADDPIERAPQGEYEIRDELK